MAACRAPQNVRAHTGSVCVRVVLRRVVPCAAPEPLGAPRSLGTCPLCTPSGGGRSTGCAATARAREDPARRTGPTREGVTAPPARSSRCATGVEDPKTPKAQSRARRARRAGAGRSHGLWPPPAPMRIPPRAVPILVRHDRAPHGASGGTHGYIVDPPPQARTRHEHEVHAESGRAARTARGCRPRPRRSHAGHGTTGSICYVPHTVRRGACTKPPAPLGARLSAMCESRPAPAGHLHTLQTLRAFGRSKSPGAFEIFFNFIFSKRKKYFF